LFEARLHGHYPACAKSSAAVVQWVIVQDSLAISPLHPNSNLNWINAGNGRLPDFQNVIERAIILCDREMLSIDESCLQRETLGTLQRSTLLSEALTNTEKEMIEAALEETGGRVSGLAGAAVELGIPGSTLESRIRSLQINKNLFRSERRAASIDKEAPLRQGLRHTSSGL
jgi:hypothetical protein